MKKAKTTVEKVLESKPQNGDGLEKLRESFKDRTDVKKVTSEILDVFKKNNLILEKDGKIDYSIDISPVLGNVINSIRQKSPDVPSFYLEGAVNNALGLKLKEHYIPLLNKIYDKLKDVNGDGVVYNDLDNKVEIIPTDDDRKIMLFKDQNHNYLVILEKKGWDTVHVRRVWSDYPDFDPEWDDFESREDQINHLKNDYYYHDCVEGNYYCKKPNLEWYEKKNYQLDYSDPTNQKLEGDKEFSYRSYGDSRDIGYVLSTESSFGLLRHSLDYSMGSYGHIQSFFLDVQGAAYELKIDLT